jgi:hypothetical protein
VLPLYATPPSCTTGAGVFIPKDAAAHAHLPGRRFGGVRIAIELVESMNGWVAASA